MTWENLLLMDVAAYIKSAQLETRYGSHRYAVASTSWHYFGSMCG